MDPALLTAFVSDWGYVALLVLLLATGVLSPVPEDVLLLAAGYLVSTGALAWGWTIPVCLVGVVGSDAILYWWGTRIRTAGRTGWSRHVIRSERLERAAEWFGRFGEPVVTFGRLVPGTRAIVFVGAGFRGIPFRRFLLYDTLGALVWVPLLTFLGSQLGEEVGSLERAGALLGRVARWVMLAVVVLLVAWYFARSEESKL